MLLFYALVTDFLNNRCEPSLLVSLFLAVFKHFTSHQEFQGTWYYPESKVSSHACLSHSKISWPFISFFSLLFMILSTKSPLFISWWVLMLFKSSVLWLKFWVIVGASLVAEAVKTPPVMQETQVQSLGWEDPLEKGMVTYSSILPWRILWTDETGGLQSMRSFNSLFLCLKFGVLAFEMDMCTYIHKIWHLISGASLNLQSLRSMKPLLQSSDFKYGMV